MLDFYLIPDQDPKPKPRSVYNYEHAGGLEENLYSRLIQIGIIDENFDCHSDFRWSTATIKQLQKRITNTELKQDSPDIKALQNLLNKATSKQCGLMAYSD